MHQVSSICLLLGSFLTIDSTALAQVSASRIVVPEAKSLPQAHVELPFRLYQDYLIVVEGSLAALPRQRILIDTGENPSVIDQHIARTLHLTGQPARLALLNQIVSTERIILPSLEVGPVLAVSLPVLVQDLSPLQSALGSRIDAIIGLDVLRQTSFTIDYRAKRIFFGPLDPSLVAVPFETGPPLITVELQAEGKPVRLLVDTGASSFMLFRKCLHGRLRDLRALSADTSISSMTGKFPREKVLLQHLRFGGADFGPRVAYIVDDLNEAGRNFDGLMGIPALGLKQVAFDFQRGVLQWKR